MIRFRYYHHLYPFLHYKRMAAAFSKENSLFLFRLTKVWEGVPVLNNLFYEEL
jgi:hypothetical protein